MRLGADPEQLRELSATLRAAARSLDEIGPSTERRVRNAEWHGPDAIRFYTKTKTVTSRWPSGIKDGAEFVIPTMK